MLIMVGCCWIYAGGLSMCVDGFGSESKVTANVTMVTINKEEALHYSAVTQADVSSYKGWGKSEHAAGPSSLKTATICTPKTCLRVSRHWLAFSITLYYFLLYYIVNYHHYYHCML